MGVLKEKVERYNEIGQTVVVHLMWRGKPYILQMFFPGAKFPTRQEITRQVEGIYPNAVVQTAYPATTDPTKPTIRVAKEGWTAKYKKSIDCDNPKGFSQRAHCQGRKKMAEEKDHEVSMANSQLDKTIENARKLKKKIGTKEKNLPAWVQAKITNTDHNMDAASSYTEGTVSEEGLRDWFGKSKSKDGKKGWVNVVTGDSCASDKPGEGIPKCVSSAKRASMSKKERRAAAAAKRREDPGQQRKSGAAAPTMVKTDRKKKTKKEEVELLDAYGETFAVIQDIVKPEPMKPTDSKVDLTTYDIEAMTEAKDKKGKGSGTKDACYNKVKSRYSVWPSAYASGALVKCRKVGAANWGNKKEDFTYEFNDEYYDTLVEKCWKGYVEKGMKKKGDRMVPNCVPEEYDSKNKTDKGNPDNSLRRAVKGMGGDPKEVIPSKLQKAHFEPQGQMIDEEEYDKLKDKKLGGYADKEDEEMSTELDSLANRIKAIRQGIKTKKKPTPTTNTEGKQYQVGDTIPDSATKPKKPSKFGVDKTGLKGPEKPLGEAAAWTKKSGKNPSGGLNEKGRKSYERENPGSDLKAPSKKVGNKRRASFCARMKGMKKKLTSAKTANDPDSRINKSLRAWNC
mgnify:FL=1